MSGVEASLAISVFLACAVEAVEAFTIVLAVGSTRNWSSALLGVGVACLVLAILIAILGPALTVLPFDVLRLVVGGLLLIFGLQWLRKAILRAGGAKALHDEEAAFEAEVEAARRAGGRRGIRLLRLRDLLQSGPARGVGGGLHRDHLRRQPGRRPAGGPRRPRRGGGRRRSRGWRPGPRCRAFPRTR